MVALSLLALPMAGAQTKSTSESREVPRESGNIKGCSRVKGGALCSPEPSAVRRPRFGKAENCERRWKRTKAEVRRRVKTLLRPSEVWSALLSAGPGRRRIRP